MPSRPSFISVAAQKTGTGWLYDQARSHPDAWMPPIKELNYLSGRFSLLRERAVNRLAKKEGRRPLDQRDITFLDRASRIGDTVDLDEYRQLFAPAGDLITGDVSPGYHRLSDDTVATIARGLPDLRVVCFLRDPIDRLWSQINMRVRYGRMPEEVLTDRESLGAFVRRPLFHDHSFQSQTIRQWREAVGDRFRVFVMDDLITDPMGYRRAVFAHIGLDGDRCALPADHNKKSSAGKVAMPGPLRVFLADYFAEEYDALSREVGHPAIAAWRAAKAPQSRPQRGHPPREKPSAVSSPVATIRPATAEGAHRHPDFICIGSQKAGTRWLYDQLASHPDVWMPPIKELRYFSRAFKDVRKRAAEKLERMERLRPPKADDRMFDFLRRVAAASGTPNVDEYRSLFTPAGGLVTGDISPAYHGLDGNLISRLKADLPDCRFLFVVRDPIGRLWSQVNMRVRAGEAPPGVLSNLTRFKKRIDRPRFDSPSHQSDVIRRWRDIVGDERFKVFVMDDLIADPADYRRRVFAHIGLDAAKCTMAASMNRKDRDPKADIPDDFWEFLQDRFRDEYAALKTLVGGAAVAAWPVRPSGRGGKAAVVRAIPKEKRGQKVRKKRPGTPS